ncbi:MAG: serine/threonine protein kinase [Candidatus Sericytochromatia bacterium]
MIHSGDELKGEQGSYRVEQVLHASPQLVTARALDADGQQVVLKELRLDRLQSWKVLELFERETTVLRQLDHPRLPRYLDTFQIDTEADTCLYLVCSWAEGESLLDKLEAGWQPDEDAVWDIARQTLELLDYLHRFNPAVIHRDLKPGNLIMGPEGQIHLVDLGSVQGVLNPDGGSTVVGTFGYMPPEQFSDQCVPASDLYALGATLVHLLTGKYPSDLPRKGLKLDYQDLLGCSPAYKQWLDKLLDPIVEKRFASAADALKSLDEGLDTKLGVQGGKRIETLQRGTQLTVQVNPQGIGRIARSFVNSTGIITAASGITAFTALNLIDLLPYWLKSELFGSYYLDNYIEYTVKLILILLMYNLATRLVQSRIRTRIQLQPDRYLIRHSLGPLHWRVEGVTTELTRLKGRFSLFRSTGLSRLSERSGLSQLAALGLNRGESRELASHIGNYLEAIEPGRGLDLVEQSLETGRVRQAWHSLHFMLYRRLRGLGASLIHLPIQRRLERVRNPKLRQTLLSWQRWQRLESVIDERGLQIRLAPKGGTAIWSGLLLAWGGISFSLGQVIAQTLLIIARGKYLFYYETASIMLLAAFSTFAYILLLAHSLHYLRRKLYASRVDSRLSLQGTDFEIRHRFLGFERISRGKLSDLSDLCQPVLPGQRSDLMLSEANGRQHIAGYGLDLVDAQNLVSLLSERLASAGLTPATHTLVRRWHAGIPPKTYRAVGEPTRARIETRRRDNQLQIRLAPLGLRSRQLLTLGAGMGLFYPGLFGLATEFSNLTAGTYLAEIYLQSGLSPLLSLSLASIGLALILRAFFLARFSTTIRLEGSQAEILQQSWGFNRSQQVDIGKLTPGHKLDILSLSQSFVLRDEAGRGKTIAHCLSKSDIRELTEQIEVFRQELPVALAAEPVQPAIRSSWRRAWQSRWRAFWRLFLERAGWRRKNRYSSRPALDTGGPGLIDGES